MKTKAKQATLKDVARAADVSFGTVSRVINGEPNVSTETMERVLKAIDKLNYSRNRRPKSSPEGKLLHKKNVAMLLLGMDRSLETLPSVSMGIHGAESAVADAGANLMLADLPLVDRLPEFLLRRQVHGLLAKGALQAQLIENADPKLISRLREIPMVWFLGRPQEANWGDVVESNDTAIGQIAAEYLLTRGHKRIAILDPKPDHVTIGQRNASFLWHATQNGATIDKVFGKTTDWKLPLKTVNDIELVDKLVGKLLKLRNKPTAVFAPADCIAAMIYRACTRRGLQIGKDLSLISCNNELPLLTGLYPQCTTIDICSEQIGCQAVQQLIWRMSHRDSRNVSVSIEPRLVEGMSVANLN